jgi:ribosomal protein S18 acetylase RimI-like enzyme
MTVSVRRADPAEAAGLAPVLTALCRRSKASWGYPPELLDRWANDLRIEPGDIVDDTVLVAETEHDGLVGFARVAQRTDHTQLKDLWVEPAAFRMGVGRSLWAAAIAVASDLAFDELRFAADPNAEPFYVHLGARRIGMLPSEIVNGRTLPLMAFDLRVR